MKRLMFGGKDPYAGPALVRSIVESDRWFVPVLADGAFATLDVEPGRYRLAIGEEEEAPVTSIKKRRGTPIRGGKGGRLLLISTRKLDGPAAQLDGRALARSIPGEIDGLLLDRDGERSELGRGYLDDLAGLADACELEEMLATPGPDQVERLKRATWFVALREGRLPSERHDYGGRVAHVWTHPDRAIGERKDQLVAMNGERLFRLGVEDEGIDGLLVNRGQYIGRGKTRMANLLLGPGIVQRLLDGEDPRPGAYPLPARSRDEVRLWLDWRRFPYDSEGRELVEESSPDDPEATWIRATATDPRVERWRSQESLDRDHGASGERHSPLFVLKHPIPESGFGAGPTRILCAGLLASALGAQSYQSGKDPRRLCREGRWLLFGRLVDAAGRERARRQLALAQELAKLLPPDADQIPRSAVLTVEGSAVFSKNATAATRSWIEAMVRESERYTRRWVWGRG
jgi:hypothetical protein